MFENIGRLFKRMGKNELKELDVASRDSKETAKERLHMVLMQDRANVSADFLELMKEDIVEVIKKYIEIDEDTIDVRLTTKTNDDGTNGTPALYANIPILNIRNDMKVENFNFKIESDGTIIAQKIEEPVQEDSIAEEYTSNIENDSNVNFIEVNDTEAVEIKNEDVVPGVEIDLDKIEIDEIQEETIVEIKNIDEEEEKVPEIIEEKVEGKIEEPVPEIIQETISEEEQELKIEERQRNLINEIIPKIESAGKEAESKEEEISNEPEEVEEQPKVLEEITAENVQLLKKSAKRGRPKKKDNSKKNTKKNTKKSDEDDDDVTFDDLLKAAEEEDKRLAEQEKKRG